MIISRLCDYARRRDLLGDPAFERKPVRFVIELGPDGAYRGIVETQGSGKRGKEMPVPKTGSRNDGKTPCLFTDTIPRVVQGRGEKQADYDTHANFVLLSREVADSTGDPGALAAATFLEAADTDGALAHCVGAEIDELKPKPGDWVTFSVEGAGIVIDRPAVKQVWRERCTAKLAAKTSGKGGEELTCLACGREEIPLDSHGKLRGVPGGNPSGTSLVSADKSAFGSYGLSKSATSPVCSDCVEAYTRALNDLLASETACYRDNDASVAYVFWTRQGQEDGWYSLFSSPDPAQVKDLMASPHRPRKRGSLAECDEDMFYALSLSGVGGRAMVRDWIEETVPRVRENIRQWFEDISIVLDRPRKDADKNILEGGDVGAIWAAWSLTGLKRAVGRPMVRGYDVPARAASDLFRAAVLGHTVGEHILSGAVRRIQAEHDIPPQRAAVIRLALNRISRRNQGGTTEMALELDMNQTSEAYRCGRLLKVLARLQYLAQGSTNATILDRFYGAASTSPASVFGRLLHLSESHLHKLAATMAGAATNIRKDIEIITTQPVPMMDFPRVLSLEDQGRFALGFYHQNAHYRALSKDKGGSEGDDPTPVQTEMPGDDPAV